MNYVRISVLALQLATIGCESRTLAALEEIQKLYPG